MKNKLKEVLSKIYIKDRKIRNAIFVLLVFFIVITLGLFFSRNRTNKLKQTPQKEETTIEASYCARETNANEINVTIYFESNVGIKEVIEPNGNEINVQVENKKKLAIDYKVTSGEEYVFKIKLSDSNEFEDYTLYADINAKPIINQGAAYAYPILYDTGFKVGRTVSIDYGESTEKFYSIDDGNTWNEYTGEITIHNECNLIAKTKNNTTNEIVKIDNKKITLGLANDAIGTLAYDGNKSTSERCFWGCKFYVDPSAWEKTLNVKFEAARRDRYRSLYLYLYKYDDTFTSFFLRQCDMGTEPSNPTTQTKTIKIPQNTYYVKTSDVRDYYGNHSSCIFEMWITN